MKVFSVRLEDEDQVRAEEIARAARLPVAILLRQCIRFGLPNMAERYGVEVSSETEPEKAPA